MLKKPIAVINLSHKYAKQRFSLFDNFILTQYNTKINGLYCKINFKDFLDKNIFIIYRHFHSTKNFWRGVRRGRFLQKGPPRISTQLKYQLKYQLNSNHTTTKTFSAMLSPISATGSKHKNST